MEKHEKRCGDARRNSTEGRKCKWENCFPPEAILKQSSAEVSLCEERAKRKDERNRKTQRDPPVCMTPPAKNAKRDTARLQLHTSTFSQDPLISPDVDPFSSHPSSPFGLQWEPNNTVYSLRIPCCCSSAVVEVIWPQRIHLDKDYCLTFGYTLKQAAPTARWRAAKQ